MGVGLLFLGLAAAPGTAMAASPGVHTGAAYGITSSGATLTGQVNAGGQTTQYHFDYYPELSAGCPNQSSPRSSTAATDFGFTDPYNYYQVNAPISGLTPDTMYCVQLVASNVDGTTLGSTESFRTAAEGPPPPPPGGPVATTGPATSITSFGATLNGTINPHGSHVFGYFFYYGPSSSAWCMSGGTGQPPSQSPLINFAYQDSSDHPVSWPVHELERGTTYCYRLVSNSSGRLATFTTRPPIPATLSVHVTGPGTVYGGVQLADGTWDSSGIQCAGTDTGPGPEERRCTLDVLVDDEVLLRAKPDPGAVWSGACSGTSTGCGLTISGDTTVGAKIKPPPKITITQARVQSKKRKATFEFTSSEPGAKWFCLLDVKDNPSLQPQNCDSPKTYKGLKPGNHEFWVGTRSPGGDLTSDWLVQKFKIKK